jgi:flagellar export protein FliJ
MARRFRLSIVLRLREQVEEQARIAIAEAIALREAAQADRDRTAAEIVAGAAAIAEAISVGPTAAITAAAVATEGYEREIATAERAIAAAQFEQQRAAETFRSARAEREAIARLKERYTAAERAARTRRETVAAAETATMRAARVALGIDSAR